MYDPFTVIIYFLSAVLQADAAFLGLGMVFIVYRMQTLYSQYQGWVTTLLPINEPNDVAQDCNKLLQENVTQSDVDEIVDRRKSTRFRIAFDFIATFQSKRRTELTRLILPLVFAGLHCICVSILLWQMNYIPKDSVPIIILSLGCILLITFIASLIWLLLAAFTSLKQ